MFTTKGLCLLLEKMDFVFDSYKKKTLVAILFREKSVFRHLYESPQNHANQAISNVQGKERGSHKFLIFVNSQSVLILS